MDIVQRDVGSIRPYELVHIWLHGDAYGDGHGKEAKQK